MNEYDSDRIYDLAFRVGFNKTSNKKEASCFVLNTCHIREKATEKVYDEIGRVKKDFKNSNKPLVIVSGCVAQAESSEMIKREPYIDMVIGPQSYHKIGDLILDYQRKKQKVNETEFDVVGKFDELRKISTKQNKSITDEASLFINQNYKIKFISGENQNNKITYIDDIKSQKTYFGIGFDIHKLIKNKKLFLGGIKIPFHSGLQGHSDGDVILHSIIDSILGAIQKKDIGTYFPSNKRKFKNIRSPKMLKPILDNLKKKNIYINNIDINLICEKPKVSKYRNKIINSLSRLMKINNYKINLKGKTVEKLGLIGKEKAIACEVITSLIKYD